MKKMEKEKHLNIVKMKQNNLWSLIRASDSDRNKNQDKLKKEAKDQEEHQCSHSDEDSEDEEEDHHDAEITIEPEKIKDENVDMRVIS